MKEYFLSGPDEYRLMSQAGVKQYCFPLDSSHNAIWDSNITEDGKLYFALASEICTSEYVHLCSYNYEENTITDHFSAKDVVLPSDRTIRSSKFHSSICFMKDGTVVMTTHTTDKAPAHPTWLPEAFYHHLWEGYAGSQIITFNPATGETKNHGTPVPRETIYGAIYDPAHHCLYFLGMFKGHLYRYSFDEKLVYDYGQVSECRAFRLSLGPDGNLYGASKSGWVFKVDTETDSVIDMNFRFEHKVQEYFSDYTDLSIARVGPDDRLYMAVMYSRSLYALDTKTGIFEDMGPYLEAEYYVRGENRCGIFGMDFDSKGVLWYVLSSRNDGRDGLEYGLPASLFRWDITRGGKPQWAGLCGTPERVGSWVSEVCITKDDILYSVGSNHGKDGPDITAIDLKLFESRIANLGGNTNDPYYDPENEHYKQIARELKDEEEIAAANPFAVTLPMAARPVALWRALAPDYIAASAVRSLKWETENRLSGYCAGKETVRIANSCLPGDDEEALKGAACHKFVIQDGKLVSVEEAELPSAVPELPACSEFPFYPGRQYLAKPSATVTLPDGRMVIGTADGMLAVKNGDKVFALGPAVYNGPVRSLAATSDGIVFGVGGDIDDLGILFRYDDEQGLRWLGHVNADDDRGGRHLTLNCPILSCCAVSPDGKKLAVGSGDRLGTVVIYNI